MAEQVTLSKDTQQENTKKNRKIIFTAMDKQATRDSRRHAFRHMPLFAGISQNSIDKLVRESDEFAVSSRVLLLQEDKLADFLFVIVSGAVQLRISIGAKPTGLAIGLPVPSQTGSGFWLHLCALGPGNLVGDRELLAIATGSIGNQMREVSALAFGNSVVIAISISALARVAEEEPKIRQRLAVLAGERTRRMRRLAEDAILLKDRGKVHLARLLQNLFDVAGTVRGKGVELSQEISQGDIAKALGLTLRSIKDDINALEDFEVIDHDFKGRLILLDRGRLDRVARLQIDSQPDKGSRRNLMTEDAALWAADIKMSLFEDGDPLRARGLAREALSRYRNNALLTYLGALAALRSGALDSAGKMIEKIPSSSSLIDISAEADEDDQPITDEDIAALAPRLFKERCFLAEDDEEARRYARQSAEDYLLIHQRSGGAYSGINAASMSCVSGDVEKAKILAEAMLAGLKEAPESYWSLVTRAEALGLLGQFGQALEAAVDATHQPDADPGSLASTRKQFRRLSVATRENGWLALLQKLPVPPVIVVGSFGSARLSEINFRNLTIGCAYIGGLSWGRDIFLVEALLREGIPLHVTLPEPIETFAKRAVEPGEGDWLKRFKACISVVATQQVQTRACYSLIIAPIYQE